MVARRKRTAPKAIPLSSLPFHTRFDLPMDRTESRRRFMNRVKNLIFDRFLETDIETEIYDTVRWRLAMDLGEEHSHFMLLRDYAKKDFFESLRVVESCYETLQDEAPDKADELENCVEGILSEYNEAELNIRWQDGVFIRTGAKLLD